MAFNNSLNQNGTGIITSDGDGTYTYSTTTQYNVQVGDSANNLASVAPSATSGVPLISQGSSSNPAFGTAVVAGGGTGNTTFTAYSVIAAGTTATGAFQNVSGVGTSGQVLTSNGAAALPTWQDAAGGGSGWVHLATGTASTSSSLDFTSSIDSTYALYALVFYKMAPTNNADTFALRTSTNGGVSYDNGATDYQWWFERNGVSQSTGDTEIQIVTSVGNDTEEYVTGILYFYRPDQASYFNCTWQVMQINTAGSPLIASGGGRRVTAADVDALQVLYLASTIASGTTYLFGCAPPS